jgi:hypothetical protein
MKKGAAIFLSIDSVLVTWAVFHFIIATTRLSNHLDKAWYIRLLYKWQIWSLVGLLTVTINLQNIKWLKH